MHATAIVLTSAATMLFSTLSSANQLTNGSFEFGLVGWAASGPATVRSDEQPSDGVSSLVFDYGNVVGGGVEQVFSTTPGTTYALSFDYWGWAVASTHTVRIEVLSDGVSLLSQTVTATGSIPASYHLFSRSFVAAAAAATLRFTDSTSLANGLNSDVSLDRIAVTPVPEAPTAALLLLGLVTLAERKRSGRLLARSLAQPKRQR